LALPDLSPALFEGCTIGMQTLDKYHILLEESDQTSLEDGHERWLWHGFLHLVDHGCEVVLEIRKATLTLKYEPFYIGLHLCSKTVQVCLLHHLIAVTGAQKCLVQCVHAISLAAGGFTQKLYAVLPQGKGGHTQSAAPPQEELPH
jgi:hypothetical protein